jgi:hypothetical protein
MKQEFEQLVKYPETHRVHADQVKSLSVATQAQLKFR